MNSNDLNDSTEPNELTKSKGTTRISANIGKIDKDATAEFSRVIETNTEIIGETDSERDFDLKLNISEVKGSISLADTIVKKHITRGGTKKWRIL